MSAKVTAVCVVAELRHEPSNPDGLTAIDKRPVAVPVEVGPLGLAGDEQRDHRHHGGEEQAVYVYADEDAAWWAGALGREITPGLFGENLRTSGLDVTNAVIGERWRVGGVLLEVTSPRIPCNTFKRRMGEDHWVKRFTERGAPGAYVAVVEAGTIEAGAPLVVERRPAHGVTIADTFLRDDGPTMRRLLEADGVDGFSLWPKTREYARRKGAPA